MKIAHLADIHIQGKERINENKVILDNFFLKLKKENVDCIIVAGDIFHTKTENITPESISLLVDFFNSLAETAETHIILGNHDGNLKNDQREDSISPIIKALNKRNLFLHKKTEFYETGDFKFLFYSLFDQDGWKLLNEKIDSKKINIAVYHGSVLGCVYENGVVATESDIDTSFFKMVDYGFLGDIHKRQDMDKDGRLHYPGSLSQLDFGESLEKGFTVWEINSKKDFTKSFVKVSNPYLFLTVPFDENLEKTQESILAQVQKYKISHGWRLRIKSNTKISDNDKLSLKTFGCNKLGAKSVDIDDSVILTVDSVDIQGESITKEELKTNKEKIKELYLKFIERNISNYKSIDKDQAKKIIDENLEKLSGISDQVRDAVIKLENYEFDNVLSYGKSNKINFSKLSGLVGIHGKNRIGKSSLIGSVALTLYNITDRAPVKSAFVVNNKEKDASMRLLFNVSGQRYLLERKIEKQIQKNKNKKIEEEDKAATSLKLFKLDRNGAQYELKNENSISRTDTEKVLRNIIGTPDDFLFTSLSAQGQINSFINSGATSRKELLNRFLDLDIFKQLHSSINEEYNILKKGELKNYDKIKSEEELSSLKEILADLLVQKLSIEENVQSVEQEIESLPDIKEYNFFHQNLLSISNLLSKKESELLSENKSLENLKNLLESRKTVLQQKEELFTSKVKEIETIKNELSLLEEDYKKLSLLKVKISALRKEFDNSKKIVKKLEIVPCEDKFPNCVYIKDAHEAKIELKNIEKEILELAYDEEEVQSKLELFNSISVLLSEEKNILNTLESEIKSLNQKISELKMQISFKEEKLIPILNTDIADLTEKKNEYKNKCEKLFVLSGINELKTEKTNLKKELYQKLNTTTLEIGKIENSIEVLENSIKSKEELLKKAKLLESILDAFSKNGIPAMLLNSQLPIINKLINDYLDGVTDFKLKFQTEVGVNTLDIFIEDEKSTRVIELASGMEKMISSLVIRAALMQLTPLPKLDSLIIDEGFDALDQNNLGNVVKLLYKLKEKFKAIYVITHIQSLKEYMDQIIEISQNADTKQSKIDYH